MRGRIGARARSALGIAALEATGFRAVAVGLKVGHQHERTHCDAARVAFLLPGLRLVVYALVDSRYRFRLGLGRLRLHEMDGLAGHDGRGGRNGGGPAEIVGAGSHRDERRALCPAG